MKASAYMDIITTKDLRTLLLNLPNNMEDASVNTHLLQPLGLAAISGYLKQNGCNVTLYDAGAHYSNKKDIINYIQDFNPVILGLTLVTHQVPQVIPFLNEVKALLPDLITVVGGAHPSVEFESLLKNHEEVDITVIGEGEHTMLELINNIQEGKSLESVNGIAYRVDGNVRQNSERAFIADLDSLPYADWESLPMDRYWYNYTIRKNYAVIVFNRGCPFSCTFCAKDATGLKQRKKSPENALKELNLLHKKYGVRDLLIADSLLNLDNKWLRELCEGMIEMGNLFTWGCQIRADKVDRETLRLMKRSGCRNIFIGVESADNEMLKRIRKGENIERIEAGIKLIQEVGINPDLGFIIGLPGETEDSIKKTIKFAKKYSNCMYAFNLASPFPGTAFYETAKKEGFLIEDWSKCNLYSMAYVPKDLTSEKLQYYYKKAVRSTYLRFSFLFSQITRVRSWTNFKIKTMIAYRIFFKRFIRLSQ